jgi:hypothetical protein
VSGPAKKELAAYVRDRFSALLADHGFSGKGVVFDRSQPPVNCAVVFVLSRDGRTFTPRFEVTLIGHEEIGLVARRDLPAFKPPGDPSRWWRWSEREEAAGEIASLLEAHGLPWLVGLGDVHALIAHLESSKEFATDPADAFASALSTMQQHGVHAVHVDLGTPRPSRRRLRPDVVSHLSHAYEAAGDPARALEAWKDYMTLFKPAAGSEFEAQLRSRLRMLEERVAGGA